MVTFRWWFQKYYSLGIRNLLVWGKVLLQVLVFVQIFFLNFFQRIYNWKISRSLILEKKLFQKVSYVIDVLGHKFGPIVCIIAFGISKGIFWIQCTHSDQNFDVRATSGRSNISSILSIFWPKKCFERWKLANMANLASQSADFRNTILSG